MNRPHNKPIFLLIVSFFLTIASAQVSHAQNPKKDTNLLTKDGLIGVWQRDNKNVGNGLRQNFRFYPDGTFVLNFANGDEDLRVIWALKGGYRLVGDQLFLTIVYRTVEEGGHIEMSGSNEDFNIFGIAGGVVRDIREPDPKELPDPLYISVKEKGHIDIGNEDYYKISRKDLLSIESGPPDSTALPALSYDSIETLVNRIRQKVSQIDADSPAWRVVRDKKQNFRGDPTDVRKYYNGATLCKMTTLSSGGSLPMATDYYFSGGVPIFVRQVEKEPASGHTRENTYYFQGPHLIKAVVDNNVAARRQLLRMEGFIQKEIKLMQ